MIFEGDCINNTNHQPDAAISIDPSGSLSIPEGACPQCFFFDTVRIEYLFPFQPAELSVCIVFQMKADITLMWKNRE